MKLIVGDFSGGLTDATYTSGINCAEVIDNVHITRDKTIETAPGIEIFSTTASRLPNNKRVSLIAKLNDATFVAFSEDKAYKVTQSAITEIVGPGNNPAFNEGTESSLVSVAEFNGHLICTNTDKSHPIKIYTDNNVTPQLRTAGLPAISAIPTITATGTGSSYSYALVRSYIYNVASVTYADISAPLITVKVAGVVGPTVPYTITGIATLANGTDYNYDLANIKVQIYRTTVGGTAYYYVGEVANGSTVPFVDNTPDTTLINGSTLYINGGIVGNDSPPLSKYVFEANDTYYYLDITQNNESKPFRLLQSITNDPDSVPSDFSVSFKDKLTGGGAIGRTPIIFTKNSIARLDGIIDEAGRGSVNREILSNSIGCVSMNSIVKSPRGLYFASESGFYVTTGYDVPVKLANDGNNKGRIDSIYRDLINKDKIQGVYNAITNRVYWTACTGSADNDIIFVYEETHDSFTTLTNEVGILPTALIVDGEDLIIGDSKGYLFRMSKSFYTHPVVDTMKSPSLWSKAPIKYRWKSVHFTMGDSSVNKWITGINVQGKPETNVNMDIISYTNGEADGKHLYPIRTVPYLVWGDFSFSWGDSGFVWNRISTVNQTRSFPSGRLRARQRQIEFTNAYFEIQASGTDNGSLVTINSSNKTATIVTPASYAFGLNMDGYDMVIDGISYKIKSGSSDTIVLESCPINETYAWTIMGYAKGQRAQVLNFSLKYEALSDAGTFWRTSSET